MDFERAAGRLRSVAATEDARLPLAEGALLIAACRMPDLEIEPYLARIAALAEAARAALPSGAELAGAVGALTHRLARVEGFRGNTERYADLRNSFLNEVLEHKVGIPISLSVLYIEVGERLGLDVRGVSFPGHFLVRFASGNEMIVLDPFFGGISLDRAELLKRMRRFVPDDAQASAYLAHLLRGAPKVEILARMLRNLREIYLRDDRLAEALTAADQIVALTPFEPTAVRERGDLYLKLDVAHAAAADYRHYLNAVPEAADAAEVRARLVELERSGAGRLN